MINETRVTEDTVRLKIDKTTFANLMALTHDGMDLSELLKRVPIFVSDSEDAWELREKFDRIERIIDGME